MVFCSVRRNAPGTGQHAADITHLVQATWGTLNLQAIREFQSFYGLVSHDDGDRIASASFYSDKEAAFAANTVIVVWGRMHARKLLPDPRQGFLGEASFTKAWALGGTSPSCA